MIKSFIHHLNELANKKEYELIQSLKITKVNFHKNSLNGSIFAINFNAGTQMLSLRKDNYLIDEVKVYDDTFSGEQSLGFALKKFIETINEDCDKNNF